MTEETKLVFDQLEKAITRLEQAVQRPVSSDRLEIDGTIQRFEFTIELFWKALKKKLFEEYGVEVHAPKQVLQQAYVNKLIYNETVWLSMLTDRNLTSHTYKQSLADQIYKNIKESYSTFLRQEFEKCYVKK
ncbi:MAG: HI0074 family nucleotidyltransferase substrate-binding subunit [Candidatus Dependentiae bacterium]|nr:HI0074 family nucleotidyltransferase substrate-binding subunit [Candidatus Dependentiae bacterium]